MKVIGITGGVGCGKSLVLALLREKFGFICVEADLVAKEIQEPGGSCYGEIVKLLGRDILEPDGTICRKLMAERIFGDDVLREKVNSIVHPGVISEIKRKVETAEVNGAEFIFVEAALLLESGLSEICQEVWYVSCDYEVRVKRLMENRGYERSKTDAIIRSQKSDAFFRENCDEVIDNSGSYEELEEAVTDKIRKLRNR